MVLKKPNWYTKGSGGDYEAKNSNRNNSSNSNEGFTFTISDLAKTISCQ